MGLERRNAGVEHDWREADALGHEPGDELGRERTARARHLRAAGFGGVHVLVGGQRPTAPHVPVLDRPAVDREVRGQHARQVERGEPQAGRAHVGVLAVLPQRVGREQVGPAPFGQEDRLTGRRAGERAGTPAQLQRPQARRQSRGEVDDDGLAVGGEAVERGRHRPRRVHHHEVAGLEEPRQLAEGRVYEATVAAVGDQHAHRVARDAPGLRRHGRLQLGGQDEPGRGRRLQRGDGGKRGRHAGAPTSWRAW